MKQALALIASLISLVLANLARAQSIPNEILGNWVVSREIPTTTISCWGDTEAKSLLQTQIEYSLDSFRWKNTVTSNPNAATKTISAEQFRNENSGSGSQITFRQVGINKKTATQVTIHHPPASITGATGEIPGDEVLLKNRDTIVFAVCNVYFEAKRVPGSASGRQATAPILVHTSDFEGVILPADMKAFQSEFPKGVQYWTPTESEVLLAEKELIPFLSRSNDGKEILSKIKTYKRQYVGIDMNGDRSLYMNLFCDAPNDWRQAGVVVVDGGSCFFNVRFEIATKTFSDLRINGNA